MSYIYDQILTPPSDILTNPMDRDSPYPNSYMSEAEALQLFFSFLGTTAGVRYRLSRNAMKASPFLCLNWIRHRIWNDLQDGQAFPMGEPPMGATEYTAEEMAELLMEWGLVPCADYDDERMILIWTIGTDSPLAHVGHIQVRQLEEDTWESKVSETAWVITHAEDDFQYYKGRHLVKACPGMRYFKLRDNLRLGY